MTKVIISVPNNDVDFISTLAYKMGWKIESKDDLLSKFIKSFDVSEDISEDEIQEEVNAVRYKK